MLVRSLAESMSMDSNDASDEPVDGRRCKDSLLSSMDLCAPSGLSLLLMLPTLLLLSDVRKRARLEVAES